MWKLFLEFIIQFFLQIGWSHVINNRRLRIKYRVALFVEMEEILLAKAVVMHLKEYHV